MDLLYLLLHTLLLSTTLFQVSWGTTSWEGNCNAFNKNIFNPQNHSPVQNLIRQIFENGYSFPVNSRDELQEAVGDFSTLTGYELEPPFEAKVEEELYCQEPQPVEYRNGCHALNQESLSSRPYVNQCIDPINSLGAISDYNSGIINSQENKLNWQNQPNIQRLYQNQQVNTGYWQQETPNRHCLPLFEVTELQFPPCDTEILVKTYPQNTLKQSKSLQDINNYYHNKQFELDNFENQQCPVLEAVQQNVFQQNNQNTFPYDSALNGPYQPNRNYDQNQPQTNENYGIESCALFEQKERIPIENCHLFEIPNHQFHQYDEPPRTIYPNNKPMNWQNQQDVYNYYQNQHQMYKNYEELDIRNENVGNENCPLPYEVERKTFGEQEESIPNYPQMTPYIDQNLLDIQKYLQDQPLLVNNIRQSDNVVNYNCPYPHEASKTEFHETVKESPQNIYIQDIPVKYQQNCQEYAQQIKNEPQSVVNENCQQFLLHKVPKSDFQEFPSDSLLKVEEKCQIPFVLRNEYVNKHSALLHEFQQSNVDFQQMRYPNYYENSQTPANRIFLEQTEIDETEYEHEDEECLVGYESNRDFNGVQAHLKEKLSTENLALEYHQFNEEKLISSDNQPKNQNSFIHDRYGELYQQHLNGNQPQQNNLYPTNKNYNIPQTFRNPWLVLEETVCHDNGVNYSNNENGYKTDTSLDILTTGKDIFENIGTTHEETLVENKCVYVLSNKQWEQIMLGLSQVKVYPQEIIERCFAPDKDFVGRPDTIGCGNLESRQEFWGCPTPTASQTAAINNIMLSTEGYVYERF